jgi:hypothetical protein
MLNSGGALPITRLMSIETTLVRVSAIRQELTDPAAMIGGRAAVSGGTEAPSEAAAAKAPEATFASALQQASGAYATAADTTPQASAMLAGASGSQAGAVETYPASLQDLSGVVGSTQATGEDPGARIVAIAESQLGQTEQPPGSNESPAIAQYRTATVGAQPGAPWCAYFASWAASQAGEPLGAQGQGSGSVEQLWSWAQSTGRAIANGPGVVPRPGDLIVFGDQHVGIVKDVLPNGQIQTIEGNYENKVAANVRSPTEASGYVNMS